MLLIHRKASGIDPGSLYGLYGRRRNAERDTIIFIASPLSYFAFSACSIANNFDAMKSLVD